MITHTTSSTGAGMTTAGATAWDESHTLGADDNLLTDAQVAALHGVNDANASAQPVNSGLTAIAALDPATFADAVWAKVLSTETAANELLKARRMQTNKAVISGDTVSIYADDDVTLLHQFSVSADKNTRVPV